MLDEITLDVIDAVKAEKLKTAGKSTVNRYLGLVRAVLRRARIDWEWTDKTPKVKMFKEPPGRERSITVEQAETLLGEPTASIRCSVVTIWLRLRRKRDRQKALIPCDNWCRQ
jgi:hypothetical protein